MTEMPIDSEMGEYLIPGEAAILERYLEIFRDHFQRHYQDKPGMARRAIHAKSHGLLRASLEILPHGQSDLQYSIFRTPGTYEAFVRISNGDGPAGPDTDKIASVGFAIKVRGVREPKLLAEQTEDSQDLLFLNQPAYISRDVRGYEPLMRAIDGGLYRKIMAFLWNPLGILYRLRASPKDNPLNAPFWGVAPFRLGSTAVKYLIRPVSPQAKSANADADGLQRMLWQRIGQADVEFDLFLQRRILDGTELRSMPIEDYSVAWDEAKSVPVKVGRLCLVRQEPDSTLESLGEQMVFSPWNTTSDFRPLGSLNRARRVVYAYSAQRRHELNGSVYPFA